MKKTLITLIALTTMLTSCKKDDDTKPQEDCNCGLILDGNNGTTNGESWYTIDVRSNCSGNSKTFYLAKGDWMNAHAGNETCITNETSW